MRRTLTRILLLASLAALAACVTINVYFPEAAAQQAAGQFIDKVLGAPAPAAPQDPPPPPPPPAQQPAAWLLQLWGVSSAYAQQADITVQTPQIQAIQARMQQRFADSLRPHFDSGALGFTRDGLVAVRDAAAIPLPQRAAVNAAVADENRDREAVYREIALANGHAEWAAQIRATFAQQWIGRARAGWYYQDSNSAWQRK